MNLLDKTDEEIIKIANPIWDNLIKSLIIKITVVLQKIFHLKCFMEQMKLSLENSGQIIPYLLVCQITKFH